jgi:hypothetical protein
MDPHGPEVVAAHERVVRPVNGALVFAFEDEPDLPLVRERDVRGEGHRGHSGKRGQARRHLALGLAPALRGRVALPVESGARDQHPVRREADRHPQHLDEAVDEEAGADEEHQRARGLHHDEGPAQAVALVRCARAPARLERAGEARARPPPRRGQAAKDPADHRDDDR